MIYQTKNIFKTEFETFNDGVASIYKLSDVSEKGLQARLRPILYKTATFQYKTIGVKRNYEAMQASVRLDEMIKIMLDRNISPQDIVVVEGVQYEIKQVQHKTETKPATTLLSLQRVEEWYDNI